MERLTRSQTKRASDAFLQSMGPTEEDSIDPDQNESVSLLPQNQQEGNQSENNLSSVQHQQDGLKRLLIVAKTFLMKSSTVYQSIRKMEE